MFRKARGWIGRPFGVVVGRCKEETNFRKSNHVQARPTFDNLRVRLGRTVIAGQMRLGHDRKYEVLYKHFEEEF